MSAVKMPSQGSSSASKGPDNGMTVHLADFDFDLPSGVLGFSDFRDWTLADTFPERGRFDYLQGRVEADMSSESLYSHNQPKTEIVSVLYGLAKRLNIGVVFGDRARVVVESAALSSEPDATYVSKESFESGRVTLTPKDNRPNDSVEIVGPPDLVVEVVSDSSVTKDTRDLYRLYFEAGVREYWLIHARGETLSFRMLTPGQSAWTEVEPDADGFRRSQVLDRGYRLDHAANHRGEWRYDLVEFARP